MDPRQEKELQQQKERKEERREQKSQALAREQQEARGGRIIHPLWLAVVGFVLSMLAVLRWMAIV